MPVETVSTQLLINSTGTGDGTTLTTPAGQPNVLIKVVTPLMAILIRAAKTYLQTLTGILSAAGLGLVSTALPPGDFLHTLKVSAGLSMAAGVMSLLTNLTLLLTSLGERFPTLKA